MIKKGSLAFPNEKCLIGFDAEWTKNYRIKNGNVPFCFSVVSLIKEEISYTRLDAGLLKFQYVQFYCENHEEAKELIIQSDIYAEQIVSSLDTCVLCGHQMSSDLSVLVNYASFIGLPELCFVKKLQNYWHSRKCSENPCVFDTRYDIQQAFLGSSRRLVDMSNDFLLDVTQPELGHKSMTKLHNDYVIGGEESIRERISVMNIRHSLCAAVLYWLNCQVSNGMPLRKININKTVNVNLSGEFGWVDSDTFKRLLS